jgi:NADH-quinone oxidoreductase subunit N
LVNWMGMLSELILVAGGMAMVVFPWLSRSPKLAGGSTLSVLTLAFIWKLTWAIRMGGFGSVTSLDGFFVQDGLAVFVGLAILVVGFLIVLSTMGDVQGELRVRREFHGLLLFTLAGLMGLAAAQHLVLIYLTLEMVSLFSYLMTGLKKNDPRACEAALKYFLFGAVSTGAMLYGFSLWYGLTGRMDLTGLASRLPEAMAQAPILTWVSLILVMIGLGFKLALVPFHMWAPDAYEGAATPVASFLSLGPKMAALAVMIRIFMVGLGAMVEGWSFLLGMLAVVTMTVGNMVALMQTNVKRLLAYSSIAHAGTLVIGLSVASPMGIKAILYYLMAYLLMNAGAFAGVIVVGLASGREDEAAFRGLGVRRPGVALLFTLCLLSLAGIPPLAGFFAKLWIFAAALEAHAVGLAVVAAVNTVVALAYYLRIVKAIYLDPVPAGVGPLCVPKPLGLVLGICAVGLLVVGIWQGIWLSLMEGIRPFSSIGLYGYGSSI